MTEKTYQGRVVVDADILDDEELLDILQNDAVTSLLGHAGTEFGRRDIKLKQATRTVDRATNTVRYAITVEIPDAQNP